MPANKYESAVPLKHIQEKETVESVVATNEEETVSVTEIKVGKMDDELNGYIIPHKKPGQVDVKENIEDNNENEEADKEQDQMNKESDENPQQIDEGEGNVEQDQVKDTDDPVNTDAPEMREKTFVIETMHGNGQGVFLEEPDLPEPIPEDKGGLLSTTPDGSNPEPKDDDGPSSGGDEVVEGEPWNHGRWTSRGL